jgi:hypothetical protein
MTDQKISDTDSLIADLDSFTQGALTIYDVTKALPHPYNAVAAMANTWAHDFINFAFKAQGQLAEDRARANAAEAKYSAFVARYFTPEKEK